jgi:integrase
MRASNRLTALTTAKIAKRGRYADGGGLYLQVSRGGTKSWLFRYMLRGRSREMGLGAFRTISIAEARDKALQCRKTVLNGFDPIEVRQAAKSRADVEKARAINFRECAEKYIGAHEASWVNDKHRAQWKNSLSNYAYPVIGSLPATAIDTALVLKIIEPIWATKTETASRLRGRIECVLDWAAARGYRSSENPARWRGHLDKLLPARSKVRRVRHHAAMPYSEVAALCGRLAARTDLSAKALEFTILTAGRTGEVIGSRWCEIDLQAALWTVPADRMKAKREHRVPLSFRAVKILQSLPRTSEFVFAAKSAARPLSNMAMLELLRGLTGTSLTVHGFRSSFRDWAAETTRHPSELCEMALAHVVSDKVEAAYRRGDLFEKRRRLMSDWANFCSSPGLSQIVPMRRTPYAVAG